MKLVALIEFDFPSGTRKYSFEGVRSPSAFYSPKVKSLGRIDYRLSRESGIFQIADLQVELMNVDKEFSILRAQTSFANVQTRVKFGNEEDGLAGLATLFDGNIAGWNFKSNSLSLRLTDRRFGRFRYPLQSVFTVLNDTDYPNMPGNVVRGELIPIVYGALASSIDKPIGQVPAYLVDPAVDVDSYRYVLCQHKIRRITKLYRYGIEISIASATVVYSGGITYLDFSSDQRAFSDFFAKDYAKQMVSTDLIHEWLMNEGSGSSLNDSVGSADGTLQNDYEWLVSQHPSSGGGPSYVNMGDSGYISFGTPSTILNLTGDFTLAFWAERGLYSPLDAVDEETIFDCGEVLDTKGWRFYIEDLTSGLGRYVFRTNTSGANEKTITNQAGKGWNVEISGRFSHYAIRKQSGIVTIWVNGIESASLGGYFQQPTHTDPVASNQTVKFSDSGTKQYQGAIVNLKIWDAALSNADMARLFRIPFTDFLRQDENEISADVEGVTDPDVTEVDSVSIDGGGSGYSLNDILTVVGGTGTAATLRVTSVVSNVITGVSVETPGTYTVDPSNPVSVTGGTGSGATFNLTMSEKLITNPAKQMQDFLGKIGVVSGEINATAFSAASASCDSLGYVGAGAFMDRDLTFEEAIGQIAKSFDMPLLFDLDGKYSTAVMHDYVEPSPIVKFSDSLQVSNDSFSQNGHNRPVSSVRYNYSWQWIDQRFEPLPTELTDNAEVTALGQDIRDESNLDLFWVRSDTIAEAIATQRLAYAKENRFFSTFQLPIRFFDQLILAQLFQLTHWQGIASDGNGYQDQWHRVLGLSFDLSASSPKMIVSAFALLASEVPA